MTPINRIADVIADRDEGKALLGDLYRTYRLLFSHPDVFVPGTEVHSTRLEFEARIRETEDALRLSHRDFGDIIMPRSTLEAMRRMQADEETAL